MNKLDDCVVKTVRMPIELIKKIDEWIEKNEKKTGMKIHFVHAVNALVKKGIENK